MGKVFIIAEGLENMGALRSGGQGSVYKGKRIGEFYVAVKILPTPIHSESEDDKNFKDFINEVEKLKKVNENPNPNVVKILNSGITENGSLPFIEMEFIEGPDLGELLTAPHPPVFKIPEVIKVADQLANALNYCHKASVNHGDIKSNNVKFNVNTGNYILIDFGLAIMSDEQRRDSLRNAAAVEFMAPEQSEGVLLPQSDIYSYGIILYELLAGTVPFPLSNNGQSARNNVMISHIEKPVPGILEIRKLHLPATWSDETKEREMQVPQWLLVLIEKCLQKDPKHRFTNGMELYEAILLQHSALAVKNDAEAALILQNENERLQTLLLQAEENIRLQEGQLKDFKKNLADKDQELNALNKRMFSASNSQSAFKKIPKTIFFLIALLSVGVAALAGYYILRGKTQKTMTRAATVLQRVGNTVKTQLHTLRKRKILINPVVNRPINNDTLVPAAQVVKPKKIAVRHPVIHREVSDVGKTFMLFNTYAYFHDQPDAATIRKANINRWNNARLKALDDQNGFIYVRYKNEQGQVSIGWLDKKDLIIVGN